MPKFIPEFDIWYLMLIGDYQYCVIKKPEPIPGEKVLMVQEGCTVIEDGRWYYWRLLKPEKYTLWRDRGGWDDRYRKIPDTVVAQRLNRGKPGVIPAPRFVARDGNNWMGMHPLIVPDHITDEMLGDLTLAHLQLCEELQEGKPLLKTA